MLQIKNNELPKDMKLLSDIIGIEATSKLMESIPGTYLYIRPLKYCNNFMVRNFINDKLDVRHFAAKYDVSKAYALKIKHIAKGMANEKR